MFCSRCHTPNFRTDRYCRHCGGQLPAAGPAAPMDEEVEEQLRKALALLDQGNANDALVATQAALALEPSSPFGHSVLAHVYERQGRIPEAIQQLEIVLRVHPQSTADREKLAALRGGPAPAARPAPGARPLVIAAAAACLVTLYGGIYLGMTAWEREEAAAKERGPETTLAQIQPTMPAAVNPAPPAAGAPKSLVGPPAPSGLNRTANAAVPGMNTGTVPPQYPSAPQSSSNNTPLVGRVGLPPVYNQPRAVTGAGTIGLPPAVIGEIAPLTPEPQPAAAQETENPAPGAPAPPVANAGKPDAAEAEPIETDSGFIRVARTKPRVEAPAAPRRPAAPPSISISFGEGGAESLLLEAQREEGRAEEAAKTGNQSEASRRYRNALRLYENIARRGGAEAQPARAGADNCRKALSALGGG